MNPVNKLFVNGVAILLGAGIAATAFAQGAPKRSLAKIKAAQAITELAQNAALYGAVKAGIFKEEGLDVEIVNFRSWTEPVQAIAGDAAQFALGAGSLIRAAAATEAPVRQIAMISSLYPYEFYVKRDSGIKTVTDLRGKTIQTVRPGETLDIVWTQILAGAGMKMADVKRVESFNGFGTIVSGSTDVANISHALLPKARAVGLVKIIDYTQWRRDKGLPSGDGANLGWGTSVKMLKDHPDSVRAFLRALTKATVRLKSDKTFTTELLQTQPFGLDRETAAEVYDLHRGHWMVRLDFAKNDMSFDTEMVEIALSKPKGSIDMRAVSDAAPITEVLRELKVSF
ncbi:MAG: ABC transporter substrate-binding protein [Burkholderiales bacterium]